MLECIEEKKNVLKELCIFQYCSDEEIHNLEQATSEYHADRLSRVLINKYFDLMDEEERRRKEDKREPAKEEIKDTSYVVNSLLSKRTINALMRAHLTKFDDFMTFAKNKGWNHIKNFGTICAKETFQYLMPDLNDSEIDEIVEKYK